MVRVGLITTCGSFSGNTCLARRVKGYLEGIDNVEECVLLPHSDAELMKGLESYCKGKNISKLIGIHSYRSGKWLKDCSIPYCLILGGTDATIFLSKDEDTLSVMRTAINRASFLISFADWMVEAVTETLGDISCPIHYIPQSVDHIPDVLPKCPEAVASIMRKKCFCLVAGIRPVKDILFLVDTMDRWHGNDAEVQLLIVGEVRDGTYASEVKSRLDSSPSSQIIDPLPQVEQTTHALMRIDLSNLPFSRFIPFSCSCFH
eukprot:m.135358 g.135358  ORF g.135358 m.135358 type:complete len:261 (-) comp13119_c0_seq2:725-1507(-)